MVDLILVFGATSIFFGVMAVIGYVTNADFSRIRNFLMGGLIFLVVFWLLSMFINLGQFEMIVCYIGIFIFLGFTAYDTQKIRLTTSITRRIRRWRQRRLSFPHSSYIWIL